MARIRTIKPTFFVNEEVAALPYEWRLLFIGLWTQADREGRLEDRPQRLKAALFAYDDLQINEGLGCLVNAGLISRYEANGQRLISITTWGKHQKPHKLEPVSELPPPDHEARKSPSPPGGSGNGELILENGVQRAERARGGFEQFWDLYPRKVAKEAAWKVWEKLAPDGALTAEILAAVIVAAGSQQWRKDDGQYIPHARTFLSQKRWKDEDATPAATGKPDMRGHFPPCESRGACTVRALEEIRAKARGAAF